VVADKLGDVLPELIADPTHALPVFCGFFDGGGIFQIPLVPPDGSGENRTGSLLAGDRKA